jgi:hypothetical protein
MTLQQLKERVNQILDTNPRKGECTVCVPNNKGGMGGTSVTEVDNANCGIDWDNGKFILRPTVKMIEMPPTYSDNEMQRAIQQIGSYETAIKKLIHDSEGEQKNLKNSIRFANRVLEAYKK